MRDFFEDGKVYQQLKELNRAYQHNLNLRIAQMNYLDGFIDKSHPGLKKLIPHGSKNLNKDKLLDFIERWPHSHYILKRSEKQFIGDFQKWAKKKGYHPNERKAKAIYSNAQESIPSISSSDSKLVANVPDSIEILRAINKTLNSILTQMEEIATGLEEYEVAKEFSGISTRLAIQIVAELGDLSKFENKKCLISFTGIDAPPYESGNLQGTRRKISKKGNAILRKVLFTAMNCMKKAKNPDNDIYTYMMKKQDEGKAKKLVNIAGMNKFLRIYYARVMERKVEKELSLAA